MLRRLWPAADVELAVKRLEEAGEWQRTDTGWYLPNWNVHLLAASEVEHRNQQSRETSERYRRHGQVPDARRMSRGTELLGIEWLEKRAVRPWDIPMDHLSGGARDGWRDRGRRVVHRCRGHQQ